MSNLAQKEIAAHTNAKFLNPEKQFKSTKQARKITTKKITYCASLVAASLICKMLGQLLQFGTFKITLVYVPWIMSAVILGPIGGAAVGFCTDLLGTFVLPTGGPPLPLLVLSSTFFPFIIGIAYKYIPLKSSHARLYIGSTISILVCTLGISTYALYTLNPYIPLLAYLVIKRFPQAVIAVLNVVLATILLPMILKIKNLRNLK